MKLFFSSAHCQVEAMQPSIQKTGFLNFHSDVHVVFYVKITCWHFITCYKYLLKDLIKPSFNFAKIIFSSLAFLYSLGICEMVDW